MFLLISKKKIRSIAMAASAFMVLTAGFIASPTNYAEAAQEQSVPTLSVDGEGTASAVPDMATVAIGVTSHAASVAKAQNDNTWSSNQINNAVRALGIAAKDIQTNNYSVNPTYRSEQGHYNEIDGYTVNNTIVVKVRDIKQTGKVIDAALGAGANEINSLNFTASDTEAVRQEALINAIKDARSKADAIAKGLGMHITGVQNVSANNTYMASNRSYAGAMLMAKASTADMETSVEPGSLTMHANVHIDYTLGN